ncbi:hypothetical protein GGR55DRAFT_672613 [Xylaria sp. FL0064]|nr:hypothetical protein GGR55DRAFT_672613 [Xylaria sp. FL0064]
MSQETSMYQALKDSRSEPTRHQPQRAARKTRKLDQAGAQDVTALQTLSFSVRKKDRKPRGFTARQRRKIQQNLIKKVELKRLTRCLGRSDALPPPTSTWPSKQEAQVRRMLRGKKYIDDILNIEDDESPTWHTDDTH